jgi:hypothetical protein
MNKLFSFVLLKKLSHIPYLEEAVPVGKETGSQLEIFQNFSQSGIPLSF